MDGRLKKMADALSVIAFERKHATGGYLSRTSMAQIARRALTDCELEWPQRNESRINDLRQLFFEGSIYARLTAKDLEIEVNGVSHMVSRDDLKLAVSEAIVREMEDSLPPE